jgi:hypothetical protein
LKFHYVKIQNFLLPPFAQGEPMTTAEQIYRVVKELPEPMRQEVLDFVEFLKQKTIPDDPQSGNLPVPPRQLSRNTDDYFDNPQVMEAIERGREDIKSGRVTTITDPNHI